MRAASQGPFPMKSDRNALAVSFGGRKNICCVPYHVAVNCLFAATCSQICLDLELFAFFEHRHVAGGP
jgi:hypothetical protein